MKLGDRLFLKGAFDVPTLSYLKQLGVEGIAVNVAGELESNVEGERVVSDMLTTRLRSGAFWETADLMELRDRVAKFGLELSSLAHTPPHRYRNALFGLPGRDEEIENWCKSLHAMAECGIKVLQYSWHSNEGATYVNWHTSASVPIRGGALGENFDYDLVRDAPLTDMGLVSDGQLWDSLEYFLKAVVPVAERLGVRLAMHPADPQVPSLAGIARIIRSQEAFDRMLAIAPSKANAMTFCQGCFSQMLDAEGVYSAINKYVSRGVVAYVHFRNVSAESTAKNFTESFWDDGKVDMAHSLDVYREAGYDGYLTPDHHPHVIGDTVWGHRSRGFALGYIRGLMQGTQLRKKTA